MELANEWKIDLSHSHIDFTVRHMVVSKVRGRFGKWSGSLRFDEQHPERSSIEVDIDVASVDTGDAGRDTHLRAHDFFDVERFPRMTFKSTGVTRSGDDLRVEGQLTIRDVTRPVVLAVELGGSIARDPWGMQRTGFTATTTIDRKEFGVSFNAILEAGGLAVGDKVTISIDLEATRAATVQPGPATDAAQARA